MLQKPAVACRPIDNSVPTVCEQEVRKFFFRMYSERIDFPHQFHVLGSGFSSPEDQLPGAKGPQVLEEQRLYGGKPRQKGVPTRSTTSHVLGEQDQIPFKSLKP